MLFLSACVLDMAATSISSSMFDILGEGKNHGDVSPALLHCDLTRWKSNPSRREGFPLSRAEVDHRYVKFVHYRSTLS